MKRIVIAVVLSCFAVAPALADTCQDKAAAKKLHGAAETSFVKKCKSDAKTDCKVQAEYKNLHGAAYDSFVTKCNKDK